MSWFSRLDRRILAGVGAGLVLLVLGAALLRDDDDGGPGPVAATGQTFGGEWTGPDGARYRLTVIPDRAASDGASKDGCIAVPEPGSVNLTFSVRVENVGDDEAPVPEVRFGTNLTDEGEIDPAVVSFATASRHVEVQPHPKAAECDEVAVIAGVGTLDPGETKTYTATFGSLVVGATQQPFVIAQWDEVAGEETSPTEILIPFAVAVGGGSTSTSAG
jgi:hypothetical protein